MRSLTLALALALAAGPLAASTWSLDMTDTQIGFQVTHLSVAKVHGRFNEAESTLSLDDKDLSRSKIEISIPVKSVSTGSEKRDAHLQTDDFFGAKENPNITFKSTKIAKDGDAWAVTGDLSIHGVTKPVTLKAEISEPFKTDWGVTKRAFSLKGSINRFDYNVSWGKKTSAGSFVVAETVDLIIDGQIDQK